MSIRTTSRQGSLGHRSRTVSSARSTATQLSINNAKGGLHMYTDSDIIRSRSWSVSRVKTSLLRNVDLALPEKHPPENRQETLTPAPSVNQGFGTPRHGTQVPGSRGRIPRGRGTWTSSEQPQRLFQQWAAVEHCRTMRRASEMVQHRLDPMYLLSGSHVPLQERYQVNDSELERLRQMAETSQILQHDLKKIKYLNNVRDRKKVRAKPRPQPPRSASSEHLGNAESEIEQNLATQVSQAVTPMSEPPPNPTALSPSSPVSTPDATPRVEPETVGEEEQEEVGETEREEETQEMNGDTGTEQEVVENGDADDVDDNT